MLKQDTSNIIALSKLRESQRDHDNEVDEFTPVPYHEVEVDDFPLAVFPTSVRRFVEETADSGPSPRDFAALAVLAVAGGLIGNKRVIEPKLGWQEFAQGWFAIVGPPGSGKTDPLRKAMQPVIDRQTELWNAYQEAKKKYDVELAEWKADRRNSDEPTEPQAEKSYVSDSTFEALIVTMQNNPNMIAYWDEMSGWIQSMDQYRGGTGGDKAHYLSMWSFAPVNITRMTRTNYIPDPHLAIIGGIQPDVLAGLRKEVSEADGFIHRILFAFPDRMKRGRSNVELSAVAKTAWKATCDRLHAMTRNDGNAPVVMKMSDEARLKYNEWQDDHYAEVNAPEFPDRMEGVWSKLEVYMLRLALTVHMLRVVSDEATDEEIDARSILSAAELIDYFKSHARRVYEQLSETNEDKQIRAAVKWLKRREGRTATHRDMQRYHVAGIKTADQARHLIDVIVKRGHAIYGPDDQNKPCITLVCGLPNATNATTRQSAMKPRHDWDGGT